MWYVLYVNCKKKEWVSFERPELAMGFVNRLVRDGYAKSEIIILNVTNPDNMLSVEEFRTFKF